MWISPFSQLVSLVANQTFSTGMFSGNCPQNFGTFIGQPLKSRQSAKIRTDVV